MPNKARRLCSHPLCGNWMPCTDHAPPKRAPYASSRRRERIGKSGWEQQRQSRRILYLHDGMCHVCNRPGGTIADHVISIEEGLYLGLDLDYLTSDENMRPCHRDCHDAKTQAEAKRGRERAPV